MQYFISFLEGMITFISPCLLPLLPVYISYFAGEGERTAARTLRNAFGFVAGFTAVFVLMGALAGTVGGFLQRYRIAVNLITGLIVIFFGLHFLGVIRLNLFRGRRGMPEGGKVGFLSSLLFGMVFSVGWTPCVGAFLGSALMLASQQGKVLTGVLMLLAYSAGLGIPFVFSAVLIDRLKGAFQFIKRNYRIINLVCGSLLILVGILMMTGLLGRLLTMLSAVQL
ncbi:MAG: cytochrome c biogenesis protein CcdA [Roseburia sp.]|nr:cytochrome c biogenesis protein CcdA [Roseburia sp.]MCM1097684.1 cytochrome c biogenesis protein CcdA [Ruminococcus flavefaciens]